MPHAGDAAAEVAPAPPTPVGGPPRRCAGWKRRTRPDAPGRPRDLRRSIVPRRPLLVLPYVALVVALVVWLAPDLGDLPVPVAVYAPAIDIMAVLATGVSPLVRARAAASDAPAEATV